MRKMYRALFLWRKTTTDAISKRGTASRVWMQAAKGSQKYSTIVGYSGLLVHSRLTVSGRHMERIVGGSRSLILLRGPVHGKDVVKQVLICIQEPSPNPPALGARASEVVVAQFGPQERVSHAESRRRPFTPSIRNAMQIHSQVTYRCLLCERHSCARRSRAESPWE